MDETVFATYMEAPFRAATKVRPEVFSGAPVVASTIAQITRLAFPQLMIEIKCGAKM